jgi:methylenetetrahydrofolate reductase (NADPH)
VQIKRITELSGATIPAELMAGIEKFGHSPNEMEKFGTEYAVKQVKDLLKGGISHFHFYTMNRHQQTRNVLYNLRKYFPRLNFY